MAGGRLKYRHLSRDSAHRKSLLRNLVTSLIQHESISTTWHKAKEAQRLAEKLITLGKRNTEAARIRAHQILFNPHENAPKIFNELRERYATRPGGYTRVLRIEPIKEDQAPSAILELVDGPRDMRFALTAQTIARDRALNRPITDITALNVAKVTKYRGEKGDEQLKDMVRKFEKLEASGWEGVTDAREKKSVYWSEQRDRDDKWYTQPRPRNWGTKAQGLDGRI